MTLVVAGFAALRSYDEAHRPPLQRAARDGDVATVVRLLRQGTDVNEAGYPHRTTALHAAALYGRPRVAEVLLAHGAKVDARDEDGYTPLHWTADEFGKNSARPATRPQRLEIAGMLLRAGAPANAPTRNGYTPLHLAVSSNIPELVRLLLDHGANPNARDDYKGTPLHLAKDAGPDGGDVARLLLDRGADVDAHDERGKTPLDYAADQHTGVARAIRERATGSRK